MVSLKITKITLLMKTYLKYLLLFISVWGTAQTNITENNISLMNTEYKDFITINNLIYALTQNSEFVSIDLKTNNFKRIKDNITAIAKKSNNEIIFGSKDGTVSILTKNQKIKQIDKVNAEIFSILINSKDKHIIYSNKSIRYNKIDYIPEKKTNFYGKVMAKFTGTKLIEPDYIYLDKMNFLWFAFDEGEWGGNICFFDLNKKEFIYEHWLRLNKGIEYTDNDDYIKKLKETHPDKIKITSKDTIYQYPYQLHISSGTKGVVYDNDNLIISSSGGGIDFPFKTDNEFTYFVDGEISIISKKENKYYNKCYVEKILENDKYKYAFSRDFYGFKNKDRKLRENILSENEINVLGTITFNKYDNNLYAYTTKGFYKLKNINCDYTKDFLFKPNLTNSSDYHPQLDIVKFEFISKTEIIFLTTNNGIGYYNGQKVTYIK
jgi:3-methyladenine DNA glycosylase AlkC